MDGNGPDEQPLRVLVVDDSAEDRARVARDLASAFDRVDVVAATAPCDLRDALSDGRIDAVVTEYRLGWTDGLAVLRDTRAARPDMPVVMCTASGGEEVAARAMRAGLDDYVLKAPGQGARLVAAVEHALAAAGQRRRLREAEARLRDYAERMRVLAEASRAFTAALDERVVLDAVARAVRDTLGDLVGVWLLSSDHARLELVALHHPEDAAGLFLRAAAELAPIAVGEGIAGRVAATGRPVLLPAVQPSVLAAEAAPAYRPYFERFPTHSVMVVPLTAGGAVAGVLWASRTSEHSPYTTEDQTFLEDLADRAGLALANARLYASERAAVRARDEFLATASHELRTPVTALKGHVDLLRRAMDQGRLDEARLARAVEALTARSAHLVRLTEDLLDVSRVQSGRLRVRRQTVDLLRLVASACAAAAAAAGRHRVLQLLPETVCPVEGDPDRIGQVLANLLDNAVKYSPDGGVVEVSLAAADDGALLRVRDRGIGLPPEQVEALFRPFVRATNATERHLPGLGLGLYVCRGIVELHRGRIWAESDGEGQGTTMSVWLPCAPAG